MRRLRCDRSENNTSNTQTAKLLHIFQRSDAPTKFNRDIDHLNDLSNHSTIRRLGAVERAVEVDSMNHLRSRRHKLLRHRDRVLIVNSHVRLPPLQQPDAFAALKIDRRYYHHNSRLSAFIRG